MLALVLCVPLQTPVPRPRIDKCSEKFRFPITTNAMTTNPQNVKRQVSHEAWRNAVETGFVRVGADDALVYGPSQGAAGSDILGLDWCW